MVKGKVHFLFIFGNLLCGTGKIGAKNCAICENLPKKRDYRSSPFLGCILLCKEGDDKRNKESDTDDRRFHNDPGLEGGLFVHTHKALDRPETSGIAPNIEPKPTGRAMPFRGGADALFDRGNNLGQGHIGDKFVDIFPRPCYNFMDLLKG